MKLRGTNQYKSKFFYHKIHPLVYISILFLFALIIGLREEQIQWEKNIISPLGSPVFASEVTPTTTRKPQTNEEIVKASKHPEEIMHIWEKETTYGRNTNPNALHNICKAKGKSNEFGYGGMAMKICFDSFEDAVKKVDEWLTKRDKENLCYYNIGVKTENCEYLK